MFLRAKRTLRAHPGWDDEQVAEACGIHKFDLAIVKTARKDIEADGKAAPDPVANAGWNKP